MGLKAFLIGVRIVEETDERIVCRLPWWMTNQHAKDQLVKGVLADRKALGREPLDVDIGHRLISFKRKDAP